MKIKNIKKRWLMLKKINYKNSGISILIAMGTSMMVLGLAFATLNSIAMSQEQASNIQRSTQLFYASESGIEAAFFHHNARGSGVSFPTGTDDEQTLDHDSINTKAYWTIKGHSTIKSTATGTPPIFADILKENQTIQIPLYWDSSAEPTLNTTKNLNYTDGDLNNNKLKFHFYQNSSHIPTNPYLAAKTAIEDKYGVITIPETFDFGEGLNASQGVGGGVLIDWSISRKNSSKGIQTFVPTVNEDCTSASASIFGFICEKQLLAGSTGNGLTISTNNNPEIISGKILPGSISTTLDDFWKCTQDPIHGAPNPSVCSDYRLTFRPLLKFTSEDKTKKIKGIPFIIEMNPADITSFPKHYYSIVSNVKQTTAGDEKFTQKISFDVNERNSIGAFDYVIFD